MDQGTCKRLLNSVVMALFQILKEREELYDYMKHHLKDAADALGEKLVIHPRNPISFAITLDHLRSPSLSDTESKAVTFLGSKLFTKFCLMFSACFFIAVPGLCLEQELLAKARDKRLLDFRLKDMEHIAMTTHIST